MTDFSNDSGKSIRLQFVAFSDLQAHQWKTYSVIDSEGVASRVYDHKTLVHQVHNYCYTNNIEVVMFLGDLYEQRREVDVAVQGVVLNAFDELLEDVPNLILLAGNHDYYYDGGLSTLSPFYNRESVWVFDKYTRLVSTEQGESLEKYNSIKMNGIQVRLLPYTRNEDLIRDFLDSGEGSINLLHVPFQTYDKIGVVDKDFNNNAILNLCGHIHVPNTINEYSFILGSSMQLNWGDSGGRRGFYHFRVFDDNTTDYVFIESTTPKFITACLSDCLDLGSSVLTLDPSYTDNIKGDNFLRIVNDVDGVSNEEVRKFKDLRDICRVLEVVNVDSVADRSLQIDYEAVRSVLTSLKTSSEDARSLVLKYLDEADSIPDDIDSDKIQTLFIDSFTKVEGG